MKFKNRYIRQGVMYFLVGMALIAGFYALHHTDKVIEIFSTINGILLPFYMGIVMAYLLCPVYNRTMKLAYKPLSYHISNKRVAYKLSRTVGSTVSMVVLISAIGGFLFLIIPDLVESIVGLIQKLPTTIENLTEWFKNTIQDDPEMGKFYEDIVAPILADALKNLESEIIPNIQTIISDVSIGIIGMIGSLFDVFVALIICVYILNSKERFQAQAKKFILAVCKKERAEEIFELGYITNLTFGGFINGKIIDSIIIGILCFVVMNMIGLPIPTLISVIVGVTNIIPFFGPFIGAIPSIIILLIIDPMAAVKFAIWVLILQQLDGNIIGPKILGNSTGLASFWVMFAIIVGGGLFGFAGMVLGVPTFAVIYIYVSRAVNNKLKKKQMNSKTEYYEIFDKYEIDKEDIFGNLEETAEQ